MLGKLSISAVAAILMTPTALSAQMGGGINPGVHVNPGASVRGAVEPPPFVTLGGHRGGMPFLRHAPSLFSLAQQASGYTQSVGLSDAMSGRAAATSASGFASGPSRSPGGRPWRP